MGGCLICTRSVVARRKARVASSQAARCEKRNRVAFERQGLGSLDVAAEQPDVFQHTVIEAAEFVQRAPARDCPREREERTDGALGKGAHSSRKRKPVVPRLAQNRHRNLLHFAGRDDDASRARATPGHHPKPAKSRPLPYRRFQLISETNVSNLTYHFFR